MQITKTQKMVWSGVFVAMGVLLPFLTGQLQGIGQTLLPMHLPVFLCGFICGAPYGLAVGLVVPLLRSVLFGMPVLFPTAISMAVELGIYGVMTGLLYRKLPKKNGRIYIVLVAAMLVGRLVAGSVNVILYGIQGKNYSIWLFFTGMFVNAIPGIMLQLILIPVVVLLLQRAKLQE